MPNLTLTESNNILAATSGGAAYQAPVTPVMVALLTAMGSETAQGVEVTGGSYSRQGVIFAVPANGVIASAQVLVWTDMPACTVVGVEEYDSASPPVRRWFGQLSSQKIVNQGDTFSISAGSYTKTLH